MATAKEIDAKYTRFTAKKNTPTKTCPVCNNKTKKIPVTHECCGDCWSIQLVGRLPLQDGVQIIESRGMI